MIEGAENGNSRMDCESVWENGMEKDWLVERDEVGWREVWVKTEGVTCTGVGLALPDKDSFSRS